MTSAQRRILLESVAGEMFEALSAICEFWDHGEAEGISTPLHPDALIGGHAGDDVITIHEVIRALLAKTGCR